MRREDDTRKLKREARKEKKKAEKEAKDIETRRIKGEQRREMETQLKAIKEELGDVDLAPLEKLLEDEWDEAEWERVVGELFAAADANDDDKPSWDDGLGDEYMDDQEYENGLPPAIGDDEWPEEAGGEYDGPIDMDADFIGLDEPKASKKSKKNKKKKEEEEPQSLAERAERLKSAADTMRSLDYEDEVGGLKTRFKYTKTVPETFGLTPTEILLATDAELNALVSIKHMQPYRRGGIGIAGRGLGKRVRDLKATLAGRKWGEEPDVQAERNHAGPGGANALPLGQRDRGEKTKRLGRKEREKRKAAEGGEVGEKRKREEEPEPEPEPEAEVADTPAAEGGKKKRRKKKKSAAGEA